MSPEARDFLFPSLGWRQPRIRVGFFGCRHDVNGVPEIPWQFETVVYTPDKVEKKKKKN